MPTSRFTYRDNNELFRNREQFNIDKYPEEMTVDELIKLKKDIKRYSNDHKGDYVLVSWIGPVEGPIRDKDKPGPKTYCHEMRDRKTAEKYYKKMDEESMGWDPHMGPYWDVDIIDARIEFLEKGPPSNEDSIRKVLEKLRANA